MKVALVIPSISKLDNLANFNISNTVRVFIVDEGDEKLRAYNSRILDGFDLEFFGPDERADILGKDVDVIPNRCHAETSFGFYQAYQENMDVVIELDDDCWRKSLVDEHLHNLAKTKGLHIKTKSGWFNTLNYMGEENLYPRGFPYEQIVRDESKLAIGYNSEEECILNMGLWSGQPDLDAATILSLGGLNGRTSPLEPQSPYSPYDKIVVDGSTFFPICSMNTAFRAEIIPAFYQMYMNYEGLDRYCDIWSGLFIKKIADHLHKNISLGAPVVEHRKTERSTFKDLRAEHEGMAINETLWKVVRDMQLEGKTYWDAYDSLIVELNCRIEKDFADKLHQKMLFKQIWAMRKWLELFE